MTESKLTAWWPLLLPLSYLLHLGEEWWGGVGFAVWTERALGAPVSTTRFLVLNGIVWPSFAILTALAIRREQLRWFLTTFATLVVINAALHVLGSLGSWSYSPGLLTGLLLYFPVGGMTLALGVRELPPRVFLRAVILGFAIHAVVAVIAFV
jgi:Protein of unknown function with HXXEE motif